MALWCRSAAFCLIRSPLERTALLRREGRSQLLFSRAGRRSCLSPVLHGGGPGLRSPVDVSQPCLSLAITVLVLSSASRAELWPDHHKNVRRARGQPARTSPVENRPSGSWPSSAQDTRVRLSKPAGVTHAWSRCRLYPVDKSRVNEFGESYEGNPQRKPHAD
ncbi:hypothetical protein J1605_020795 [Eschrichtius robustus]|uniref:Uncharacterized protein n=1 Tax=Eschrichtius robustus TaxID=9764 RepID=A0AB34HJF7_ESCRO|nr:hypothetical protein J1605_020795 [Eschrichtius robustus]